MNGVFPPTLFTGFHYGVVGLGRNGNAAVAALLAMGATVQAWDDRETTRAALPAHPRLKVAPFTTMLGLAGLILSPGIPHHLPTPHPLATMARDAGVPILSDAEILFRAVRAAGSRARFAGVTGTNGKSTTTVLLAHMLAASGVPVAAGGNLGPAALSLPLLPDDGVYVLEMSSYMLERLDQLHFDAACLLNLSADHLDRHGDMAGYAAAKLHVFDHQHAGDLAVLGATLPDLTVLRRRLAATGADIACISGRKPCNATCTARRMRYATITASLPIWARSMTCPAPITVKTQPPPRPWRSIWACHAGRWNRRLSPLPPWTTGRSLWPASGASASSTTARPPIRMRPRARWPAMTG